MSGLVARDVRVEVGPFRLVDDVSLTVEPGEVLALVGPNGAGKSTLLGCLAGDRRPTAGTVELDGRPLSEWQVRRLARERAVLPQDPTVSFPFTAQQVVEMGRAPWPDSDRDDELVRVAMDETDVAHLASRPVPSLSGGERARVALARVLAQDTPLLLLDEPTAALDIHHQEQVLSVLAARARAGVGVVLVVHDLAAAAAYADRIAVLEAGRLAAIGPPREVMEPVLLSRVYRHEVDVFDHPGDGALLVVPTRRQAT